MQTLINIVAVGGIYSLIACGLVLIYRTSRVVNLGHGQLAIFCTYLAAVLSTAGQPWYVSIIVSAFAGGVFGLLIYLSIMRRILGQPPFVGLMTSIGVSILVTGLIVSIFGGRTQSLEPMVDGVITLGDRDYPAAHIVALIGAWFSIAVIVAISNFTRLGLLMRAVTDDVTLASQRGININRVVALAWILAIVSAALAGVFFGQRALISTAAVLIGVNGLIAALIGGMDSLRGAIIGGLAVAAVEYLTTQFLSARYAEMAPAILMLVAVTLRPWGLFGTAEEVERV
ncbi:MAG: branched-chain amino acid ABC transporter permease [Alphaproteobacteria bacterium]